MGFNLMDDISPRLKSQIKDALGEDAPTGPVELKVQAYLDNLHNIDSVNIARAAIAISLARKLDWDYGNTAAAIAKELNSVLSKIDESTDAPNDLLNQIASSSKMGNRTQP